MEKVATGRRWQWKWRCWKHLISTQMTHLHRNRMINGPITVIVPSPQKKYKHTNDMITLLYSSAILPCSRPMIWLHYSSKVGTSHCFLHRCNFSCWQTNRFNMVMVKLDIRHSDAELLCHTMGWVYLCGQSLVKRGCALKCHQSVAVAESSLWMIFLCCIQNISQQYLFKQEFSQWFGCGGHIDRVWCSICQMKHISKYSVFTGVSRG